MYSLDTLFLFGNPIVNTHPSLAKIENNLSQVKKALDSYFGGSNISNMGSIGGSSSYGAVGSVFSQSSGGSLGN